MAISNYLTVRFKIIDRGAFEEFHTKLCNALGSKPTSIPGATVEALSVIDMFSYEDYSDYLLDAIDQRIESYLALTYNEWIENGKPFKHDRKAEYVYDA